MTGQPVVNIDDWYDVAGLAIITIGGWLTTLLTIWVGQKRHASTVEELGKDVAGAKEDLGVVRSQVENSHQTNLRVDIDGVREIALATQASVELVARAMGELKDHVVSHGRDIGGLREEIGGVRGELRQVREDSQRDRVELERRVTDVVLRTQPQQQ